MWPFKIEKPVLITWPFPETDYDGTQLWAECFPKRRKFNFAEWDGLIRSVDRPRSEMDISLMQQAGR